jgi:hypothetical protein
MFEVAEFFSFLFSHHHIDALPMSRLSDVQSIAWLGTKVQASQTRAATQCRLSKTVSKKLNLKECRVVERKSRYAVDLIKSE